MLAPLRTRRAFAAVSRSRNRSRSGSLWVVRAPAPGGATPGDDRIEVGYAIGRPVGTAVVRNRLRRRLRVLMRDLADAGSLEPGRYLVGAQPTAAEAGYATLRTDLARAIEGLG